MTASRSPRVLITGATGALGPRVAEAFVDAGYAVRTLSLDDPPASVLPSSLDIRKGNITDGSAVAAALEGVQIVVHLAALLHVVDPTPEIVRGYQQVNVEGTKTLLEKSTAAGVERFVFFSTISVYGSTLPGELLNEASEPQPVTEYARSKLEAEGIVLSAVAASGEPLGTVLRMAAIYGSRVRGNYWRLVRALARGRFVPVGSGMNRRTLLHDRDAAQAALVASEHPDAAGMIFNVSDGAIHTLNDIIAGICEALGRKPPSISIPTWSARFAGGLLEASARLLGRRSPITRATVDKYVEDIAVDSSRIRSMLGFKPRYSLSDGWQETISEMRRTGDL